MTSDSDSVDRVASYWNARHGIEEGQAHDNFLNHPLVQAYISLRAFGSLTPHLDVVIAELRTKTRPGARVFSPGCGSAGKEIALARALPDRQFIACDVAKDALETARSEIAAAGLDNLTVFEADFNELSLDPDSLDAVAGMGAFHHVEALEDFWAACRRALRPGGVVMGQEYIGPNRLQWTDRQIEAADRALADVVPAAHKVDHASVQRTPVQKMLETDPSEAPRSEDILPTLKASGFELHGYASGGGALLQPVLMYQVHTFDPRDWEHNLVLAKLFQEEARLMEEGVLEDDFCMFVTEPLA